MVFIKKLFFIFSLFPLLAYAQSKSYFPPEDKLKLNDILKMENYPLFYQEINSLKSLKKIDEAAYIDYLKEIRGEGHIPLYWLMADHYANKNDAFEAQKWYYIALITTQQDSYLCSDVSATNAPKSLNRIFMKPLEVARKNPQNNDYIMPYVIDFVQNLNKRSNPKWVCIYGSLKLYDKADITIPKNMWEPERKKILDRFDKKGIK